MKRLSLSSLGAIFSGVRKLIDRTIGTAVKSAAAEASAGWEQFVSDEIPIHNIVNPIVDYYFKLLPTLGYKYSDVSRMWYFTKYVNDQWGMNYTTEDIVAVDWETTFLFVHFKRIGNGYPIKHSFSFIPEVKD